MKVFTCVFSLFVLLSLPAVVSAQEVPLPLTWKGDGSAMLVMDEKVVDFSFQASIKVDTDGWVTGEFVNEEGEGVNIERFFYTDSQDGIREVVVVLADKTSDNPILILLPGKVVQGKLFYGEVLLKEFEAEGEIEKGLNLGDKSATQIWPDYLPESLKNAMKACKTVGCFGITGSYAK